ncbi:ACP S-malonyltransferase [bacterium]|nr:ACP S-malonyltransferase [bacterium]
MNSLVFPGQGAQYIGMGKDFYDKFPAARDVFSQASEILSVDMTNLVFNGSDDELKKTINTQPAMICTELALWEVVKDQISPVITAGHSVGEMSSLYASGVIDLASAFKLIAKRAQLMDREAGRSEGVMYAMLAISDEDLELGLSKVKKGTVVAANYNTVGQIVISGDSTGCEELFSILGDLAIRYRSIQLKVSGAWHSPFMEGAVDEYSEFIDSIEFKDATMPVVLNVSATSETQGGKIKAAVKKQIVSPVRWTDTMKVLSEESSTLIEIGPGNVLTGLMKRFSRDMLRVNIEKTEHLEYFNKGEK